MIDWHHGPMKKARFVLAEKERATKIIDELPKSHPFGLRYTHVGQVKWESCSEVLNAGEKKKALLRGWHNGTPR